MIRATAGYANTPMVCAYLNIRSNSGNAANILYTGGAGLTTANAASELSAGQERIYTSGWQVNAIDLGNKYILGGAAGVKCDLDWQAY
jgi:hypothetical protein